MGGTTGGALHRTSVLVIDIEGAVLSTTGRDIPRVSIGMPVFNGEPHVGAAIDSLLAQTYGEFELIISDNASTDRTAEICQDRASRDPRIRHLRNATNVGPRSNFMQVLSLARGEFFMWAAHDDWHDPKYIEECLTAFARDPGIVLVGTAAALIDTKTNEQVGVDPGLSTVGLGPAARFRRYRRTLDTPRHYSAIFYGLYRRSALERVLPWPPIVATDQVLLARLCFLGSFFTVPETRFFKRFRVGVGFEPQAAISGITSPSAVAFTLLWRELAFQRAIRAAELGAFAKLGLAILSWALLVRRNGGWGLRTWVKLQMEQRRARRKARP